MEVKSVYMDLQEWVKKGNVWKLESEAFKKPIEIKIWYDNKELAEFRWVINDLVERQWLYSWKLKDLWIRDDELQEWLRHSWELLEAFNWNLDKAHEKIENQNKEISSLYKVIADLKTTVETLSGTILHLQDEMKLIQKKITKQPMVFSDRTFISGHEQVGLSILDVPSGDYLLISKYEIWNANEHVDNVPYTRYDKITVTDNQYIPMYRLIGWTDLDTPTADIFWTLVFIPC